MRHGHARPTTTLDAVPELRRDPITGRLVIVAPERAARPDTFRVSADPLPAAVASCPFCPGHEAMTPPEVARAGTGAPDTPGWRVRVVPNLYPVVGDGVAGAHEVLVLSPEHDRPFAGLTDEQAVEVLTVARARAATHLAAGRAHVQVFVNHGKAAGASIEHPHAQIIGLDFVPPEIGAEMQRYAAADCDLVARALDDVRGSPFELVAGDIVAWCPPASAAPFEVVVAHADAGRRFDEAPDAHVGGVALATRDVLASLRAVLGEAAYNLTVHTAPRVGGAGHWYARVTPRLTVTAGFEQATGVFVNIVPPEVAAATLRAALPVSRST